MALLAWVVSVVVLFTKQTSACCGCRGGCGGGGGGGQTPQVIYVGNGGNNNNGNGGFGGGGGFGNGNGGGFLNGNGGLFSVVGGNRRRGGRGGGVNYIVVSPSGGGGDANYQRVTGSSNGQVAVYKKGGTDESEEELRRKLNLQALIKLIAEKEAQLAQNDPFSRYTRNAGNEEVLTMMRVKKEEPIARKLGDFVATNSSETKVIHITTNGQATYFRQLKTDSLMMSNNNLREALGIRDESGDVMAMDPFTKSTFGNAGASKVLVYRKSPVSA